MYGIADKLNTLNKIKDIVDDFFTVCPKADAASAALGVVIAISAVIKDSPDNLEAYLDPSNLNK